MKAHLIVVVLGMLAAAGCNRVERVEEKNADEPPVNTVRPAAVTAPTNSVPLTNVPTVNSNSLQP